MSTETASSIFTFNILLERKRSVEAGLEKLNKRARRKGLPLLTWIWGKPFVERHQSPDGHYEDVATIPITLPLDPPRYDGWQFVATLQHLSGENIVRAVSGRADDIPRKYRTAGPQCEHCRVDRLRADTYLLKHDDGRFMQVGSTCLKDFLGNEDALKLASGATFVAEAMALLGSDESFGSEGGGRADFPLETFLGFVALAIREVGWFSAKVASERDIIGTGDAAWEEMTRKLRYGEERAQPTKEDQETAERAAAWAESLSDEEVDQSSMGSYLHNIRAIARSGLVDWRTRRMAASIVAAYQRAMSIERMGKAKKPVLDEWLGAVGEKLTVVAKLDFLHSFDTAYGVSTILKFVTPEGAAIVWKASSSPLDREDLGKTYKVVGTVKAHDTYKDRKQTSLTRAKVEEVPEGTTLSSLAAPEKKTKPKAEKEPPPPMPEDAISVTKDEAKFIKTVLVNDSFPISKDYGYSATLYAQTDAREFVVDLKHSKSAWIRLPSGPFDVRFDVKYLESRIDLLANYDRDPLGVLSPLRAQDIAILREMFEKTEDVKKMLDAGRSLLAKIEAKQAGRSAVPNGRGIMLTEPQASFLEIEILGRFIDDENEPKAAELAMAVAESLEASGNRRLDLDEEDRRLLQAVILDVLNFIDDEIENYKKGDSSALRHIGGVDTLQSARGLYKTGESIRDKLKSNARFSE